MTNQVTGLWIITLVSAAIAIFVMLAEPAPITTVYNPDGTERVTTIVCEDRVMGIPIRAQAIGNQTYLLFADDYALALDKLPNIRMKQYAVVRIEDGLVISYNKPTKECEP